MNLLEYQNSVVTAQGNALTSLITLYEALGGGWDASYLDTN
jgi:outer membrane protein TolC